MSRSYRKPYASIVGVRSVKQDRTLASRAFRRLTNFYLRSNPSEDSFLLPHRYEATHNSRYSWTTDGRNRLIRKEPKWFSWLWIYDQEERRLRHYEWWLRIQRK